MFLKKRVKKCIFDQLYRELRTRKLSSEEGLKYIYPGNCYQNRPSDGLTKSSHQINWLEMWCRLKYEATMTLFWDATVFDRLRTHRYLQSSKSVENQRWNRVVLGKTRRSRIWDFRGKQFFTLRFGAFFTERAFWDICGQKFDFFLICLPPFGSGLRNLFWR